jgi:hypothetical protein
VNSLIVYASFRHGNTKKTAGAVLGGSLKRVQDVGADEITGADIIVSAKAFTRRGLTGGCLSLSKAFRR